MTLKAQYPNSIQEAISNVGSLMDSLLDITGNGFSQYAENRELNGLFADCAGSVLAAYECMKKEVALQHGKRALSLYEAALSDKARRIAAIIPKTSIM